MNLSDPNWSHNQSEVTVNTIMLGDIISYSDVCNCMLFKVIELNGGFVTLQDVDHPEYIDIKTFDQFNKRWEYHGEETRTRHLSCLILKK